MLLSIIIPVYNEELTIGNIIDRVKAAVQQTGLKNEIIVVDDHSYDQSLEVAQKHGIKLYHSKAAFGQRLCSSCRFCQSQRRHNSHHRLRWFTLPEELLEVLAPVLQDKADLVIGSRYLNQKRVAARRLNAFGVQTLQLFHPTA